jgi:hypothetical protein
MGLNEVFRKVADIESNATELASQKVELALVEDIKTAIQKGEFAYEDLNDSLTSYNAIKKQFDEIFKKSNDSYDKVQKFISQAQKWDQESTPVYKKITDTSKDLGIAKEQINGVGAFEKLIGNIGKLRGEAQRILSQH